MDKKINLMEIITYHGKNMNEFHPKSQFAPVDNPVDIAIFVQNLISIEIFVQNQWVNIAIFGRVKMMGNKSYKALRGINFK